MQPVEELYPHQVECVQWLERLFTELGEEHPLVKDMPKIMSKIGKTHVIVPDAENMTEDMVDASRSLLLYSDSFSSHDAPKIRNMIEKRGWVRRHLPEWFREEQGHLTKAGRAILAYDLTLKAALYPPTEEEKYFPETKPSPGAVDFPSRSGFKLVLHCGDAELSITRAYEDVWCMVKHGDVLDIQINRHQLPEAWRKMFRTRAIEIRGVISKTPMDGEVYLDKAEVRMSIKPAFKEHITHSVSWSMKVK